MGTQRRTWGQGDRKRRSKGYTEKGSGATVANGGNPKRNSHRRSNGEPIGTQARGWATVTEHRQFKGEPIGTQTRGGTTVTNRGVPNVKPQRRSEGEPTETQTRGQGDGDQHKRKTTEAFQKKKTIGTQTRGRGNGESIGNHTRGYGNGDQQRRSEGELTQAIQRRTHGGDTWGNPLGPSQGDRATETNRGDTKRNPQRRSKRTHRGDSKGNP